LEYFIFIGARFIDLNGDGKIDFVHHRQINSDIVQKGAYLNTGEGWRSIPEYTPPFHIAHDNHGDVGARFTELNGDGKIDFIYHRRLSGGRQQKGAYINTGTQHIYTRPLSKNFHSYQCKTKQ
jgi:hypothetical protein